MEYSRKTIRRVVLESESHIFSIDFCNTGAACVALYQPYSSELPDNRVNFTLQTKLCSKVISNAYSKHPIPSQPLIAFSTTSTTPTCRPTSQKVPTRPASAKPRTSNPRHRARKPNPPTAPTAPTASRDTKIRQMKSNTALCSASSIRPN